MRRKRWIIGIGILFISLVLVLGTGWAAEKPIKLGVVFIMSGKMGGYGKHGMQAIQLAINKGISYFWIFDMLPFPLRVNLFPACV